MIFLPLALGTSPPTRKAAVAVLIYWRLLLVRSQERPEEYVIFNVCSLATGYPVTL